MLRAEGAVIDWRVSGSIFIQGTKVCFPLDRVSNFLNLTKYILCLNIKVLSCQHVVLHWLATTKDTWIRGEGLTTKQM